MTEAPSCGLTIGGRVVHGQAEAVPLIDPATGKVFAQAPGCSAAQLDQAVEAARGAFPAWAAIPFDERKHRVAAIAGVIETHIEELKELLTREQGKPYDAAIGELQGAMVWASGFTDLSMPIDERGDDSRRVSVRHLPLGVIGAIVPWNFPVLSALMKIAPALTAGNTMVLKPAPTTPLATLRLGELLCGVLPDGVLNIVSGDNDLGPLLAGHDGIDKIAFTGSTATGKKIMQLAAGTVRRFSLELGGNDPAIVLPDVDVEVVAQQIFWGAFGNSGQICVAAKRIYVHDAIYDRFLQAMLDIAKATRMGIGSEPGVALGPIQNRAQFERVTAMADRARASGLTLHQADGVGIEGGFFFPVTIVDNPPENAEIVQEEQFGPLLPLMRFDDVEDVIARANGTPYGLGGSVWSADIAQASAIADRLDCGGAWVNTIMDSPPDQPIGGHRQSGFGVESGLLGMLEYTAVQTRVTRPAATSV